MRYWVPLAEPKPRAIAAGAPELLCASYRKTPGGRLNKKDGLSRYGDSHVKDKTS